LFCEEIIFYWKQGVKVMKKNLFKSIMITFITMIAICCMMASHVSYAADKPSDETITYWVREALREDPRVISSDITISTDKGIVKLFGSVKNLAEKKYADRETKKIKGVKGVINEITIKPVFRFDADIAHDVRRRMINNVFVKSKGLDISVFDGNVTLKGNVESWAESKEAELLASEVRGVKSVINDLVVEFPSKRSDNEIRNDVISSIARDVYLTGLSISVDVKNGVVTLNGSVGNVYQKELAGDVALLVNNAKRVENKLEVKWWENEGERKKIPSPSDNELKKAVHSELNEDLRIDPSNIDVDVYHGLVTLRGSIPTYHEKRIAGQDVHNVAGVGWVSNLLSVNPEERADSAILSDVEFEIMADYLLGPDEITVTVKNGIVTLSGHVNDYFEKAHAANIASSVIGVRDIVNNIKVNWSQKYMDSSLTKRIKERLSANWATEWVADNINVTVKNGKATLTGKVNFWFERKEAGRIAFLTDGIWAVDNQLTIANVDYKWDDWYYIDPEVSVYEYDGGPYYIFYYDDYPYWY
jgi:osmotically-inducible protein OsmY